MKELTILGCGSSIGVPVIGCKCDVCMSDHPYNKRRRSSILIRSELANILVDFGFDIKSQLIMADISRIDAAILTHMHADHSAGIDELSVFKILHNNIPMLYSDSATIDLITQKHEYLFNGGFLRAEKIDFYSSVTVGDISLQLFKQHHGAIDSIGIRVGGVVYSNDVVDYPQESLQYLEDASVWIIDCVNYEGAVSHMGLEQVLDLYDKFKPKKVYLTNLSHRFDYFALEKILPANIKPAYDGLKIVI